jgi:hypothetical protein
MREIRSSLSRARTGDVSFYVEADNTQLLWSIERRINHRETMFSLKNLTITEVADLCISTMAALHGVPLSSMEVRVDMFQILAQEIRKHSRSDLNSVKLKRLEDMKELIAHFGYHPRTIRSYGIGVSELLRMELGGFLAEKYPIFMENGDEEERNAFSSQCLRESLRRSEGDVFLRNSGIHTKLEPMTTKELADRFKDVIEHDSPIGLRFLCDYVRKDKETIKMMKRHAAAMRRDRRGYTKYVYSTGTRTMYAEILEAAACINK